MSLPRFPLKDGLRDPADEAALARVWEGIDAHFPRRQPRPRAPWRVGFALVALGAAGAVFWLVPRQHGGGPLRLADGHALVAFDAPADGASISLSDGSRIELGGGARLQPLESTDSTFVAVLERGTAGFDVRPGGPRKWRIECGLATVDVVGTLFSCERSPGRLRVAVQRGSVLVSGERVPDRMRRLAAGQWLDIGEIASTSPAPASSAADATEETAQTQDQEVAPAQAVQRPRAERGAASTSWRELARGGRHDEAFVALGPQGVRRESRRVGVADLFALADVARLSGHAAEAEAPLERILTEFASDPQASLAAFALGRLELDSLGQPNKAVAALNRALALSIPQSLREDVRARLVEAYVRTGDRAAAQAAAQAYTREFPGGRHAKAIESRLSGP